MPFDENHVVNQATTLTTKFESKELFAGKFSTAHFKIWILDLGATDHVCSSLHMFHSYNLVSNMFVRLPYGSRMPFTHKGKIYLNSSLWLHDILCVPSFSFNLISLSKLTKTVSCCVFFHGDLCVIQHTT